MKIAKRATFSLVTLLLLTAIVALLVSHVSMMRQLAAARSEVDSVRRQFGYVRIDDPNLIYVSRIEAPEAGLNSYRLHIPPGHRFMLHMSETEISDTGPPPSPKPTQSMSMNSWQNGADVVMKWDVLMDKGAPTFIAATGTEPLFRYKFADWKSGSGPSEGSHLDTDRNGSFRPDQEVRFMWWRDPATKRGVVFWMEPLKE